MVEEKQQNQRTFLDQTRQIADQIREVIGHWHVGQSTAKPATGDTTVEKAIRMAARTASNTVPIEKSLQGSGREKYEHQHGSSPKCMRVSSTAYRRMHLPRGQML